MAGEQAVGAPPGGTVSIGSISLTPQEETEAFQPLADYLAMRMAPLGVERGRVVIATTMADMAARMKRGEVDLFIDSPFPALFVSNLSGAKPTLRRWKKGRVEYHSVIFARKDSGIASLGDLRGRAVAFDEEFSTSGHLLPKATLLQQGLRLVSLADQRSAAPPDAVGYVFSNDDENTMFWVLERRVAAGALDNQNFEVLAGQRMGELVVLARSITVPRHVVLLRGDLSPRWVSAIKETLVTMHLSDEGRTVLRKFERTTKFDRFPGGPEAALQPVRDLMRYVDAELSRQSRQRQQP